MFFSDVTHLRSLQFDPPHGLHHCGYLSAFDLSAASGNRISAGGATHHSMLVLMFNLWFWHGSGNLTLSVASLDSKTG